MKLIFAYSKTYLMSVLRDRGLMFLTLLLPSLLMLLFTHQFLAADTEVMVSLIVFANFAVQSVVFLSLGMVLSQERDSNWGVLLQTLSKTQFPMWLGRGLALVLLSCLSFALVVITSHVFFHFNVTASKLIAIIGVALFTGLGTGLLAISLAYYIPQNIARSTFVILNFALFIGSFSLPNYGLLSWLRYLIPSHDNLILNVNTLLLRDTTVSWIWVISFSFIFYLTAIASYQRCKKASFT